jgi:dihydrofolate reductase
VITADISVSVDGYAAGPNQRLDSPFGDVPEGGLHRWMFEEPDVNRAQREEILAAKAYVMGRNMFSPGRGAWDPEWRGWWGEEPPYHAPVFVLTHHPREPLASKGKTMTFVTGGLDTALAQAREAAGEKNVAVAGGADVIQQVLAADELDELQVNVTPVLLGGGTRLFDGAAPQALELVRVVDAPGVTHLKYRVAR